MDEFSNDTFQVINMNYKLKHIKNKKNKMKNHRNNYKNIELFETLDNKRTPDLSGPVIEPFNAKENTKEKKPNKNIEGFTDADYDGIDNINDTLEKKGIKDPRQMLIDLINKIYNKANKLNQLIAEKLAMGLSKNKANESDIKLLRNNIAWVESCIMAALVSYNLFFIMYYKDVEKIKLFEISTQKTKDAAESMPILYIFLFFFEYSIFFPEMLNKLLTDTIPKFAKQIFNATFVFTIMFVLLIFFFKYFAKLFKNFLIDGLNNKLGLIGKILTGIICVLWLASFLKAGKEKIVDTPLKTGISPDKLDLIFFVINRLLRLMAAFTAGAPMGVFLTMLYIIGYVFMSVFLYTGFNIKIYSRMYGYMKGAKAEYIPGICENPSIWDYIYDYSGIKLIMQMVDILHERLFMIAIIIILIITGIDYTKDGAISSGTDPLKDTLLGINFGLAGLLLIFVAKTLASKLNTGLSSSTPAAS